VNRAVSPLAALIENDHLRRLAGCGVLFLGLLFCLDRHALRYSVWAEGSTIVVEAAGHQFRGEVPQSTAPLAVRLYPQDRYSTNQILVRDRGFLLNGLSILAQMGRRQKPDPRVFMQPAGTPARYVHFNPFRAALTVHQESHELRIEMNVPDAAMESWQYGHKLDTVKLNPPWIRLTVYPLLAALLVAGLLCILGSWLAGSAAPLIPKIPPSGRARSLATSLILLFLGTAAGGFVFLRVFGAMPGFGDEMNYLIQGRIFASGHLFVPEPPTAEFFRVGWMDMFGADGKVWGFHPPGNSLILAIGWLLNISWLTVPIVFGLNLLVQYLLAREVVGEGAWPFVHVAIVGTSHYVLSLSSSYMAHAPSFLFISLFYLYILRFEKTDRGALLLLASACLGFAFIIRPISAVLAAVIPLVFVLRGWRKERTAWYAAAFLCGLGIASSIFLYTWAITGRFTFPYAIKGPEVGQTLWVRISRGWDVHFTNIFRNSNEFQHRVHSFGILGNALFFFVPALTWPRQRERKPLALAYSSFVFFALGHSFLHWYGWKWEPRMLFDVSFLFFLLSTAGVKTLVELLPAGGHAARVTSWAVAGALFWVLAFDLPYRFGTEYRKYNLAPNGVHDEIRRQNLHDAIVFFGAERPYSCYTPMNTVTFDGDVIYAKAQGDLNDYRLLARFPHKEAWYTADGETMQKKPNFYRKDLATLAAVLPRLGPDAIVVVPWLDVAPTTLNDLLPARKEDPGRFLTSLASPAKDSGPRLAVFLESATELARLVGLSRETQDVVAEGFEGPIAFKRIGPRRAMETGRFPGIRMTCFEGTSWSGQPLGRQLVPSLDIELCPGENRSIIYETWFELKKARRFAFSLESDDGSGLFVDEKLVIDNDLSNTHGPEVKNATLELGPGLHSMTVKYFNGPGDGRLKLTIQDRNGVATPASVAAFLDEFLFFVKDAGARPAP
jgi:hypothetical protein